MSSPLQPFLGQLVSALFEYLGDRQFALLADPPAWLSQLWGPDIPVQQSVSLGETSSFLEGFLSEAVDFWGASQPDSLDSGAWLEKSASGVEFPMQPTSLSLWHR